MRIIGKTCFIATLVVVALSFTPDAHAIDMEYYTYNGFGAVVTAFQKIALIFSDNGYRALFFTITALGIFIAGATVYFQLLKGSRGSPLSWAWPVGLGICLYLGLMIPTGSVTVYDPVLNRFQTVGRVPDGIIVVAGILNKIERGLVDIISVSGTPQSFQDYAGGIGFDMLLKATTGHLKIRDQYVDESLKRYTKDCLFFELQRPGTSLSVNDVTSSSTDFMSQYAQAANPAVFTVRYSESERTGTTLSCADAWTSLQAYFSDPLNMGDTIRYACADAGFNTDNTGELTKCTDVISNYASFVEGGAFTIPAPNFMRQVYMAEVLNDMLLDANPDLALKGLVSRSIMSSGLGMGTAANEWLPVARAVITAVAIGLIPVLVIFIPTPLVGKAMGLIAGMFIWLTAWGVTDAVTHGIATDYAYGVFEYVRQNSLGFAAIMNMPDASLKALAMFGLIRTSGIMLATVITSMLVRFGGHALAMMAGTVSGTVQSQGTQAAAQAVMPEGGARTVESARASIPTWSNANRWSAQDFAGLETARRVGSTAGMMTMRDAFGADRLAGMHTDATVGGMLPRAAGGAAMAEVGLDRSRDLLRAGNISGLGKTEGDLEAFVKSGHPGSFFDFHADQSAVEGKKRYFGAMKYDEAIKDLGREETSGYAAMADYDVRRTAGAIVEGRKLGLEAGELGDTKGKLDALQTVATKRGVESVGEDAFLDARRDAVIDDVARWRQLRAFAASKGVDFERFAADRHRTADIAVGASESKRYGLPGAGNYRMAWGEQGELLFTNRSSGSQFQVGTFGRSGRDVARYNISRGEEGSLRRIYSNFTDRVGGSHSVSYDDFRESVSGFRGRGYSVNIVEDASISGGHRVMVYDPTFRKPVLVSGNINHLVSSYRQTTDGATREAIVPLTGDVLSSESTIGSVRTQNQDRLKINMGVSASGTVTEGVRKVGGETVAVGAAAAMDGLATIGSTVRSVKQLGEVGRNFKIRKPKGEPSIEGGETVKGEVSPQSTNDPAP
jgi:conjugal transfer mating pair stabilization protein TraG